MKRTDAKQVRAQMPDCVLQACKQPFIEEYFGEHCKLPDELRAKGFCFYCDTSCVFVLVSGSLLEFAFTQPRRIARQSETQPLTRQCAQARHQTISGALQDPDVNNFAR